MHADRTNRVALIVFGLLFLVIGAGGLIASLGVFSKEFSHRTLFDNRVGTYVGHNGSWIWPAAAGVCLVIGLLALRWIVALLVSTDRAGDIRIPVASHEGTTVLPPTALTGALTREIGAYHGVEAARSHIIGDPGDPDVVLTVTASQSADLHALHQRIEDEAIAHARQALGSDDLSIRLHLTVSRRAAA
jgi:hypothetical protein